MIMNDIQKFIEENFHITIVFDDKTMAPIYTFKYKEEELIQVKHKSTGIENHDFLNGKISPELEKVFNQLKQIHRQYQIGKIL